jgi:hypothetical protein
LKKVKFSDGKPFHPKAVKDCLSASSIETISPKANIFDKLVGYDDPSGKAEGVSGITISDDCLRSNSRRAFPSI